MKNTAAVPPRKKILLAPILFCLLLAGGGTAAQEPSLEEFISRQSVSLADCSDIDALLANLPDARLVLLGESTHGTSQYYRFRSKLSQKLISERDFSFIAVEGDWASLYRLNLYVKGYDTASSSAQEIMKGFNRWPEWLWANEETAELIEWLKEHNAGLPPEKRVGFYGMDVYGQWEALDSLLGYVRQAAPGHYEKIRNKAGSFAAFGRDPWAYARAVAKGAPSAAGPLDRIKAFLKDNEAELSKRGRREYLNALQNALVLKNAEEHFRLSLTPGPAAWNSRVGHMNSTVNRLLDQYSAGSKGIVWAHNTHVGDSDATEMRNASMINIGQLARRDHGRDRVFIVGFATYTGTVLAGAGWGSPVRKMTIPPAVEQSVESVLQRARGGDYFLVFGRAAREHREFTRPLAHRAIGVVYDPDEERGNYVLSIVPHRYDALVFFRSTDPLAPVI